MKLAVHSLENHPDHARIQKLLYFVYTKLWIADVSVLEGMSIRHLLSLLVQESSSVDQLQIRLLENAERLNKAETYIQLAHSIIETLQENNHTQNPTSALPYDRFQLRYAMMQVLNPLKAKAILIALYHARSQSGSTLNAPIKLSTLTNFSLDELLRKVMQLYPTLTDLNSGLQNLQHCPAEIQPEERRQLAQTLQESLRPYLQTKISQPFVELEPPELESPELESPKLESPELESPELESPELESPEFDPDSLCTILMSPNVSLQSTGASLCPGEIS